MEISGKLVMYKKVLPVLKYQTAPINTISNCIN